MQTEKLKRGSLGLDGKVFWQKHRGKDRWVTTEQFARYIDSAKRFRPKKSYAQKDYAGRKEYHRKYMQNWREENREKSIKATRDWQRRNPDAHAEIASRRRAAKVKSKVDLSDAEHKQIRKFYLHAATLTKILGLPHHVDHIVPISKGGKHHPSNLQVLPASVNIRKSNRMD